LVFYFQLNHVYHKSPEELEKFKSEKPRRVVFNVESKAFEGLSGEGNNLPPDSARERLISDSEDMRIAVLFH